MAVEKAFRKVVNSSLSRSNESVISCRSRSQWRGRLACLACSSASRRSSSSFARLSSSSFYKQRRYVVHGASSVAPNNTSLLRFCAGVSFGSFTVLLRRADCRTGTGESLSRFVLLADWTGFALFLADLACFFVGGRSEVISRAARRARLRAMLASRSKSLHVDHDYVTYGPWKALTSLILPTSFEDGTRSGVASDGAGSDV